MTDRDKLAEEILRNHVENNGCDELCIKNSLWEQILIEAMQAYHNAKMKEITDEDIVKWAEPKSVFIGAVVLGAKAFRDGEIKHIEP